MSSLCSSQKEKNTKKIYEGSKGYSSKLTRLHKRCLHASIGVTGGVYCKKGSIWKFREKSWWRGQFRSVGQERGEVEGTPLLEFSFSPLPCGNLHPNNANLRTQHVMNLHESSSGFVSLSLSKRKTSKLNQSRTR